MSNRTLTAVPDDQRFAFLGAPGATAHELPQAGPGKHGHGEIDPHPWQDARNADAYLRKRTGRIPTDRRQLISTIGVLACTVGLYLSYQSQPRHHGLIAGRQPGLGTPRPKPVATDAG